MQRIADEVGVSTMTVSRVLSGQTKEVWRSSSKRADEIRRVADKIGYRPNAAAKAVVSGRFGAISLLHGDLRKQVFFLPRTLMLGIHDALVERNLHLTSAVLHDDRLADEAVVPKLLRELAADGLLIDYRVSIPDRLLDLVQKLRLPSLWMNTKVEQDCIYPDDIDGGRRAARHLLELGHRRIAFVSHSVSPEPTGGLVEHHSVQDRLSGAREEMCRCGLDLQVVHPRSIVPTAERAAWLAECLLKTDRPTAVIAHSQFEALAVQTAAWRRGLVVPQDLSIVTFHDEPLDVHGETMTTFVVPFAEIGRRAVGHLWDRVEGCAEPLGSCVIPLSFKQGVSTAPLA